MSGIGSRAWRGSLGGAVHRLRPVRPSVLHCLLNVSCASDIGAGNLVGCVAEPVTRTGDRRMERGDRVILIWTMTWGYTDGVG